MDEVIEQVWYISIPLEGHIKASCQATALRNFHEAVNWEELERKGIRRGAGNILECCWKCAKTPEEITEIIPDAKYYCDAGYFTFEIPSLVALADAIEKLGAMNYYAFSTRGGYLAVMKEPDRFVKTEEEEEDD